MKKGFDYEEALKAVQSGQSMTGKDGVLGPLIKQLTEAALEAENRFTSCKGCFAKPKERKVTKNN